MNDVRSDSNKERARSGDAKTRSRTSVDDISSGRRGGLRSQSKMNKVLLQRAVGR